MQNTQLDKFLVNDTVFNKINKRFISLQSNDVAKVNSYLKTVVEMLIGHMKTYDSLFAKMYQKVIFCGSFYKQTKVGKPNEFDLNVVLQLPVNYSYIQFHSSKSAFVLVHIKDEVNVFNTKKYNGLTEQEKRSFQKLIYNGYLAPHKVREWIEGIITKVTNGLPKDVTKYKFDVCWKVKKSGPAFTVVLNTVHDTEDIHIDLAPALSFDISVIQKFTSKYHVLQNCRNKEWFAIPVPVSSSNSNPNDGLHWRLSFSLQENEILAKYGRIKPVIRQLKRLRDMQNWKIIASYYIETLFMNKLPELETNLDRLPLTKFLFIMLKELHSACARHKLPYYWNNNYNLFEKIDVVHMSNIAHRLGNIIKDIEKNAAADSFAIAKYIVTPYELIQIKTIQS